MLGFITWAKIAQWCRERWELLTGFLIGVFAILFFFLRKGSDKEVLEKKSELQQDMSDAEAEARENLEEEWNSNLEEFLEKNTKIEKEHKEKLLKVEDDKKDRVKELMSSDKPEAEIAEALKGLLK